MNDFIAVLRSNVKIIVPATVIVIVLAILIGVIVGLSGRSEVEVNVELRFREMELDRDETGLLIPGPVVPHLFDDDAPGTFYLEDHPVYIESFELMQVSVSELIEYRKRGVEVHFKPFQIENEELDILTVKDELAEP